jgi:hypothetical protein
MCFGTQGCRVRLRDGGEAGDVCSADEDGSWLVAATGGFAGEGEEDVCCGRDGCGSLLMAAIGGFAGEGDEEVVCCSADGCGGDDCSGDGCGSLLIATIIEANAGNGILSDLAGRP